MKYTVREINDCSLKFFHCEKYNETSTSFPIVLFYSEKIVIWI